MSMFPQRPRRIRSCRSFSGFMAARWSPVRAREYDPSVMVAENNIIVVTINYRLGALGWLVEPGLLAETPSFFQNIGDAGNYGLMDQQFAMQWVQRNIAWFRRRCEEGDHRRRIRRRAERIE